MPHRDPSPGAIGPDGQSHPIYQLKADFFRLLGHPVRVRVLELLRDGELTVGELQAALELDSGGMSQHLTAMRRQGVLESRKSGVKVYYRVKDPRTFQLLAVAREILTSQLEESSAILGDLAAAPSRAVGAAIGPAAARGRRGRGGDGSGAGAGARERRRPARRSARA
jgi:ArsR family transcriptional regulator